jgi:uncharacterized protein (UPF0332 family)
MSLEDWYKNGWLKKHQTSREEIGNLFAIIERDLKDCANEHVSEDWRFAIAYNAARQCCIVALHCSGYRSGRGSGDHYYVIQSLTQTMGKEFSEIKDYLDSCRNKRNTSDYDAAGAISRHEVEELILTTQELYEKIKNWVRRNHIDYFPY